MTILKRKIERAGLKAQVREKANTKTRWARKEKAMIHAIRKFAETAYNNEKLHQNYILSIYFVYASFFCVVRNIIPVLL